MFLSTNGLDMEQGCRDSTAPAARCGCPDPAWSSRCLRDNHLQKPLRGFLVDSLELVGGWFVKVLEVYFLFSQRESHRLQTVLTRQLSRESDCCLVSSLPAEHFLSWMESMLLQPSSPSPPQPDPSRAAEGLL